MLVEQYRMDPAICEVVTSVFYGRMLRTNPAVAIQRRADRRAGTSPVTVHDINDGVEQHPPNSTSLYNEAEANAILKWYKEKRACTNGNRVGRTDRSRLRDERQAEKEKSILIVTLYSAQQRLLQQLLPADTEHHSFEKHGRYKDQI
jgi:superfamily I DNA and/or RNA helicase